MNVKIFKELFTGRQDAYGMNKFCMKEALTENIYKEHLEGTKRIGVYPIVDNTKTKWIAIDVDTPNFNIVRDYAIAAEKHDINVYIERSKSKGFHAWIFFEEFISAVQARLVVEMLLKEIDYVTEIFPKQDKTTQASPFGNFIFLPLFGGDTKNAKTIFVDTNNNPLITDSNNLGLLKKVTIKVFKDVIEINGLKREEIPHVPIEDNTQKIFSSKEYPCISKIKLGISKGSRSECAFRLAIHFKERKMAQDDIQILLSNWNIKNNPPLESYKIVSAIKSVFKGGYKSRGCESSLILEYCDKENCPLILAQDKKYKIEQGLIVLTFRDPKAIVFCKKNYEFRLTNLDFTKAGKFKTTLTLSRDRKVIFKDSVALDKSTHRKRFVSASKDEEIDNDLIKIEDLTRKQIEKEEKAALDKPKQLYIMTEQEKVQALSFLEKTPHILNRVIKVTDEMGVIGEEVMRLMVYLCFTSRMTKEPLSVTIKGESSSGKSYIPQRIKQLIPEEGCFFITRATQQAFFHLPEDGMKNRIIYINELPGSESSDYSIRSAQSEGDLLLWMPIKDPKTGDMSTTTKRVRGPVGFLMTTTKASLFSENETRNFAIFSDDSSSQTEKVGEITIRKAKGEDFSVNAEKLNLFKNMQRLLNPDFKVIMPFAKEVFEGFPNKPVRVRRDKERFRILIEIITILHQFHREQIKKEDGKVHLISTLADYYLAKRIAETVLLETIYEIGPASKEIWGVILKLREKDQVSSDYNNEQFEFTYRDIMEMLDWKYDKTKKWTLSLLKAGIIDMVDGGGGRGKSAKYQISKLFADRNDITSIFLPTLKDLYKKYPCDMDLFYDPIDRKSGVNINKGKEEKEETISHEAGDIL